MCGLKIYLIDVSPWHILIEAQADVKDKSLAERLIYLDVDFISKLYETEFEVSPATIITTARQVEARASLTLFSGGGSSSESKSYGLSTLDMLDKLGHRLSTYSEFSNDSHKMDLPSEYLWVSGALCAAHIKVTRSTSTITLIGKPNPLKSGDNKEVVGEEAYFIIKCAEASFALSPTDEYFAPGIAAFKGLSHLVINRLALPCQALLRVFSADTSAGELIATPVVVYDAITS